MIRTIAILFSLSALLFSACTEKKPAKGLYEQNLSYDKFVDPPVDFRSHVFYSLNDQLDPKELKWQIEGFKEAGLGGFYLHSRVGLLTEYLSEDWWTAMDAAVEAALETGLQAYFYDEDRWPSGYAGGRIPLMDESFRAKSLARLALDTPLPEGAVELNRDEDYKYVCYTAQLGAANFNGTSFVDLMNPHAVAAFIESTHDAYLDRYLDVLPYSFAFFSDEPHIHARYFHSGTPHHGVVSYSPFVRERFLKDFGYDIMDKVALLFEEKDNWREVRLHYQQTVARQFEQAFTKQISDYCELHGVKYTGHFLGEESLGKVAQRIGNSMLHYRHMQMPGIDLLGMSLDNRLTTVRSLSSVANQYSIPRRMSELFGISGHNTSFEDRKRIGNWHAINGINHFVPHLTLYSLKGTRKRDYPPTFSYHQPYWDQNSVIEDYLGRISYAATIGEYQPQILVLYPLESEYLIAKGANNFTEGVLRMMEDLQAYNYDYDLGDEEILSDIGAVKGDRLKVGAMTYQLVLIPDMISMRQSTVDLLLDFINEGGMVASAGARFPEFVDGLTGNEKLEDLRAACQFWTTDELEGHLNRHLPPVISLSGDENIEVWSQIRKSDQGHLVMLSNTSAEEAVRFRVHSDLFSESPVLWNPATEKCYALEAHPDGGYELELDPSGLVWLTTGSLSADAQISGPYELPADTFVLQTFSNEWAIQRHDPNALVLDFAKCSLDGGLSWSESEPLTGIFDRLTDQPYQGDLVLRYEWMAVDMPENLQLVVEQPAMYKSIRLNGVDLSFSGEGYFVDRSFLTAPVPEGMRPGLNQIEMALDFIAPEAGAMDPVVRYGTEIESIYLIGDFALRGSDHQMAYDTQRNQSGIRPEKPVHRFSGFEMVTEPMISSGDLAMEGYPFYSGSFTFETSFDLGMPIEDARYYLEFPLIEAMVLEVMVNGQAFKPLTWSPFRVDVTEALQSEQNILELRMTNSLRNLLGPHHHSWKEMIRVGPSSFSGSGGFPNPRGVSQWYDVRQTDGKAAYWRDEYYHIPFGLLAPPVLTIEKK
jgi:hypothetical protein